MRLQMSADNWAACPNCLNIRKAAVKAAQAELDASYGSISLREYKAKEAAVAAARRELDEWEYRPTFREDWEIYGAETGTVSVDYSGSCSTCGYGTHFTYEHPIPDPGKNGGAEDDAER